VNLLIYLDFTIVAVRRVAVSVITNREFWLGHYLVFVLLDLFQIFCANCVLCFGHCVKSWCFHVKYNLNNTRFLILTVGSY
jgi:hypothetical protein